MPKLPIEEKTTPFIPATDRYDIFLKLSTMAPVGRIAADEEMPRLDTGKEATDKGKDATDKGKDATDKGKDATDKGKDATDKGKDATDKGKDATDKGKDATDKGKDATDAGAQLLSIEPRLRLGTRDETDSVSVIGAANVSGDPFARLQASPLNALLRQRGDMF